MCVPNEYLSKYQIYFWLGENRELIDSIASGATYKEISKSEFRELPIVIADPSMTSKFIETMEPIGRQIEISLLKNKNLRYTRDLLLPRLISGELDVEQLDIPIN